VARDASRADPAELDAIADRIARRLEDDVDVFTEASLDEVVIPETMREPPLIDLLRNFARESLLATLRTLRGEDLPESCPPLDAWAARQNEETGTPLSLLLDGYQAGHRILWNAWEEAVGSEGLDPDSAAAVRRRGSEALFAYSRRLSTLATEEYMAARDERHRGAGERRLQILRRLLEGEEVDASALDHPVEGWNVAVVATGERLKEELRVLARASDCRVLVIDVYPDPWWAWLGRSRPLTAKARAALARLRPGDGERLATGVEHEGVDGFRASNREALFGFGATSDERPLVRYGDVALEDLASRDPGAASVFVATELAPLAGEDRRSQKLRHTLAAYFECGQNARATAERLGIHHQTVAQHLDAIEERIGASVASRRAELELALRLRRHLELAGR
jgi:hypothetical protein